MKHVLDIIIPTWNNPDYLNPCIQSICATGALGSGIAKVIIVNNGKQPIKEQYAGIPGITVVDCPDNLGWEGGLKAGLAQSTTPFVCFQNDDTFIPRTSALFYEKMLVPFVDQNVGAVVPSTTCAAGVQSIYHPNHPPCIVDIPWAIFFTVVLRRDALDKVGGVDDQLPGGDDIDMSIRLTQAGYRIRLNTEAFIIHHGFKTGERVHGGPSIKYGWNSPEMSERTNQALIQKHGFKRFFATICSQSYTLNHPKDAIDVEGNVIRDMVREGDKVLEVGCGFRKTVADSIAVDKVAKGGHVDIRLGYSEPSVADIAADVSQPLPFKEGEFDVIIARHILEHFVDTVAVVKNWSKHLRDGGTMIIAVPNEEVVNGIPLSSDHCHAYNSESLKHFMEALGFEQTDSQDPKNGISFVSSFQKIPVTEPDFINMPIEEEAV